MCEFPVLLAIESSCDETAAAVVRGRQVLSMAVHSQIPLHLKYGGVVPEIASRSHVEQVGPVVKEALRSAGLQAGELGGVAVTHGPGLVGALLVGVSYAKALSFALGLPLVAVNHLAGHIAANYLTFPSLEPPFTCLVASGGHSHILQVEGYTRFALLGKTRDDAAGEAMDKVARALGLPYPGGPELEKLARQGDPLAFKLHSPFNAQDTPDFSFSGLKTAAVNLLHRFSQAGQEPPRADIAASFQHAVVETLAHKAVQAALGQHGRALALAGGVSANLVLRERLAQACREAGVAFYCPDMRFCTDNAAMIGCAGAFEFLAGNFAPPTLNAYPSLPVA